MIGLVLAAAVATGKFMVSVTIVERCDVQGRTVQCNSDRPYRTERDPRPVIVKVEGKEHVADGYERVTIVY